MDPKPRKKYFGKIKFPEVCQKAHDAPPPNPFAFFLRVLNAIEGIDARRIARLLSTKHERAMFSASTAEKPSPAVKGKGYFGFYFFFELLFDSNFIREESMSDRRKESFSQLLMWLSV